MKKSIILLALPALALTGCAKSITAAEAKTRAEEIAKHEFKEEELKSIKALTVSADYTIEMSVKEGGKEGYSKYSVSYLAEISADKKFVHGVSSVRMENKEPDKEVEVDESFGESWAYVKDGKFITALHTKTLEAGKPAAESKVYYEVEGVEELVTKGFEATLNEGVAEAVAEATGKEYLTEVLASVEEQPADSGVKYEVKYASSGEGSLVVKGSVEYTDFLYEGKVKGSGTEKVSLTWDDYYLTKVAVSMNLHGEEGENSADIKMEAEESLKFKAKVSYPKLADFEKKASL